MAQRKRYTYAPGTMDLFDPTVLKGTPIKRYSVVTVSRKLRPYMLPPCFVVIQDEQGNTQTVFKRALQEVEPNVVHRDTPYGHEARRIK